MNKSNTLPSGCRNYVAYLRNCIGGLLPRWAGFSVSVIVILYWLMKAGSLLKTFIHPDINDYGYSEMMIDFEGGFVRRGLFGQIIYYLCEATGISAIHIIQAVCVLVMAIVILYFVIRFYKLNLNWWILGFPLLCGTLGVCIRKDWMLYALLIWIYWLIRDSHPTRGRITCALLLSVLGLFLHEAFIFWGIPIVMLALVSGKQTRGYGITGTIAVVLVFLLLSFFKGTGQQAMAIIDAWKGISGCEMIRYVDQNSIVALGWTLSDTISRHVYYNFSNGYPVWFVIPARLVWMLVIYFFLSNFLFTFRKDNNNNPDSDKTSFSAMLLFSFMCLLPMFIFLSCDWIRLYQYVAISTFGAYITFSRARFLQLFPKKVLSAVAKFNASLSAIVKPTPWLMAILLLVLAVSPVHFLPEYFLKRSIIGSLITTVFNNL